MVSVQTRVPKKFGLVIPDESGVSWVKQSGGMTCRQTVVEGTYLPIGKIRHNLGLPDWSPNSPNFESKIQNTNLSGIPERDYSEIPKYIRERGHFATSDEFFNWVEESEYYGWITLWDELYRFTYGVYENLDSDPRNRWDSVSELWDEINSTFDFTYRELSYEECRDSGYHTPELAIRPIEITDSRDQDRVYESDYSGLEGTVVYLMCPNAD